MGTAESELSALYQTLFEAIQAKDLDGLMAHYTSDVVYFDVVPPLQFAGSEALRARFERWFDGFQGPITMDARDMSISAAGEMAGGTAGEIAVAHWFSRARGTLRNGREVGSWVRVTSCSRRTDHGWSIFHEHVSIPADMATGKAAADLEP